MGRGREKGRHQGRVNGLAAEICLKAVNALRPIGDAHEIEVAGGKRRALACEVRHSSIMPSGKRLLECGDRIADRDEARDIRLVR